MDQDVFILNSSKEVEVIDIPDEVNCTACNKAVKVKNGKLCRHPRLHVLLCKSCLKFISSNEFTKDDQGLEEYCTWCGDGGNLVCCDFCEKAYCKHCVKRNLGKEFLKVLLNADNDVKWKCFCCDKNQIITFIDECDAVMKHIQNMPSDQQVSKKMMLMSGPSQSERKKRLQEVAKQVENTSSSPVGFKSSFPRYEISDDDEEDVPLKGEHKIADKPKVGNQNIYHNKTNDSLLIQRLSVGEKTANAISMADINHKITSIEKHVNGNAKKNQNNVEKEEKKIDEVKGKKRGLDAVEEEKKTSKKKKQTILMVSSSEDSEEEIIVMTKSGKRRVISKSVLLMAQAAMDEGDSTKSRKNDNVLKKSSKSTSKSKGKSKNKISEPSSEDESSPASSDSDDEPLSKLKSSNTSTRKSIAASPSFKLSNEENGVDEQQPGPSGVRPKNKYQRQKLARPRQSMSSDSSDEGISSPKCGIISKKFRNENAGSKTDMNENDSKSLSSKLKSSEKKMLDRNQEEGQKSNHVSMEEKETKVDFNENEPSEGNKSSNEKNGKEKEGSISVTDQMSNPKSLEVDNTSDDDDEINAESAIDVDVVKCVKSILSTIRKGEKNEAVRVSDEEPNSVSDKTMPEGINEDPSDYLDSEIVMKNTSINDKETGLSSKSSNKPDELVEVHGSEEVKTSKAKNSGTKTGDESNGGNKTNSDGNESHVLDSGNKKSLEIKDKEKEDSDRNTLAKPKSGISDGNDEEGNVKENESKDKTSKQGKNIVTIHESSDSESDLPIKNNEKDETKTPNKEKKDTSEDESLAEIRESTRKKTQSDDKNPEDKGNEKKTEISSDDDSPIEKRKSKRVKTKNKSSDKKSDEPSKDEKSDEDSDIGTPKKKKLRKRKRKSSTEKSNDDDGDSESDKIKKKSKSKLKKKKKMSRLKAPEGDDESASAISSAISSESDDDDEIVLSDDDSDTSSDGSIVITRKSKNSKDDKKKKSKNNKKKGKKGKKGSDDESDDEEESPSKSRKKIRRIMKDDELDEETVKAREKEEERRKRLLERTQADRDEHTFTMEVVDGDFVLEKNDKKEPLVTIAAEINKHLKPHQRKGIQFVYDCLIETIASYKKGDPGGGCLLAHCMGLGKTLQIVSFTHTVMYNKNIKMEKILVVCPLNTVLNWENEFDKWVPDDDKIDVFVLSYAGSIKERVYMMRDWFAKGGVLITGYEMYRNLVNCTHVRGKKMKDDVKRFLVDPGPDLVVCDEGHVLKNDSSAISKAMNNITTKRRVVLTGTPLQNNLIEYHCMVDFVKPKLLGTRKEFTNRFVNPIKNGQCSNSTSYDVRIMKQRCHVLYQLLAGCVQRQDYSVLTPYLPKKREYTIFTRLGDKQIKMYQHYLENFVYTDGSKVKGAGLFSDFMCLARVWTHPWALHIDRVKAAQRNRYKSDGEDSFIDDEEDEESSESDGGKPKPWTADTSSDEDDSKRRKRRRKAVSGSSSESSGNDDDKPSEVTAKPAQTSSRNTRASRAARSQTAVVAKDDKKESDNKKGSDDDDDFDSFVTSVQPSAEQKSRGSLRSGINFKDGSLNPEWNDDEPQYEKAWFDQYLTPEDEHDVELGSKLVLLHEILANAEAVGDKVLVFSQSLVTLDLIEASLCGTGKNDDNDNDEKEADDTALNWCHGVDYFRMDGSTAVSKRKRWADIFNDPENPQCRLFLISTKAGSLGINMVGANRVIVFDCSWNPSHDVQSVFRVYRFGQQKPVYVYRFISQGTMEEKIYGRQITKLAVAGRVVDEQQIGRHFTDEEIRELYTFCPDKEEENAVTPQLPKDPLLAEVLQRLHPKNIVRYHEHDLLLENVESEELTEEERKIAWKNYEEEKENATRGLSFGSGLPDGYRGVRLPLLGQLATSGYQQPFQQNLRMAQQQLQSQRYTITYPPEMTMEQRQQALLELRQRELMRLIQRNQNQVQILPRPAGTGQQQTQIRAQVVSGTQNLNLNNGATSNGYRVIRLPPGTNLANLRPGTNLSTVIRNVQVQNNSNNTTSNSSSTSNETHQGGYLSQKKGRPSNYKT